MNLDPGSIIEIVVKRFDSFKLIERFKVLNVDDERGMCLIQSVDVRQEPIREQKEESDRG